MRLFLVLSVVLLASGQAASQQPTGNAALSPLSHSTAIKNQARVPVPEPTERAVEYHSWGNVLWAVYTTWGLFLPALFLFSGLSSRIQKLAQRLGRNWFFTIELYLVIFIALFCLLNLPLEFYSGYVRQHEYGLSNQTFGKWLRDELLGGLVLEAAACLLVWMPYLLIKKSPRRWWLYTGALAVPVLFAGTMILPIWIAPLFNDFGEMRNKELEAKILALADRAGIDGGRVYEVNKSIDTKAVNAYVVGLFGTKRIVLWDTLLEKLPEQQVLFIMGHEMGHYVLGHLVQGILFTSVLILVALFLVYGTAGLVLPRYGKRFGVDKLSDIASLPLLLLLVNFFSLFLTPVGLAFSRHIEHEADRFGLEITQDNQAAALSFVELEKSNLGYPRPGWFYKLWRGSHPSAGERIDFCNDYRPWEKGEPLKYGRLFRAK